jgi:hypothetical protein
MSRLMVFAFAFILMLSLPVSTFGQAVPGQSVGVPPLGPPPATLVVPGPIGRPSIGLPLPTIGLPLPSIGLPPTNVGAAFLQGRPPFALMGQVRPPFDLMGQGFPTGQARWRDHDFTNRRAHNYRTRDGYASSAVISSPLIIVIPDTRAWAAPPAAAYPMPAAPRHLTLTGSVVLDVQPWYAQVFVDGRYLGHAEELARSGSEIVLDAGSHTIELVAVWYESVTARVEIAPNQSIVYRRNMNSASMPPAAPIATPPRTYYMIPGCYMGDVPPAQADLPAACDVSRVITVTR